MSAQMKNLLRAQAEEAKEELDNQLDCIGKALQLLLDRSDNSDKPLSELCMKDVAATVDKLSDLCATLDQVMLDFRTGHRDKKRVEEEVLAEIWSNAAALVYFLTSHNVPLLGYNHSKMVEIYRTLQYANRIV